MDVEHEAFTSYARNATVGPRIGFGKFLEPVPPYDTWINRAAAKERLKCVDKYRQRAENRRNDKKTV